MARSLKFPFKGRNLDPEDMARLQFLKRHTRAKLIHQMKLDQLDGGKLCPTCQLPIDEQGGSPQEHFGERVCYACKRAFLNGEATRA